MTNSTPQVYLICPVREVLHKEQKFLDEYVKTLESRELRVHYPPRDVNQGDAVGLRILKEHRIAMKNSCAAHIYWNGKSLGSFFDLGMAFMAGKPLVLANPDVLKTITLDDFDKCVLEQPLSEQDRIESYSTLNQEKYGRREWIRNREKITYTFTGITREGLFDLGMIFMTEIPLVLSNREEAERQKTSHKSFQNVLLALDDLGKNT
jgi:hypothetical protein